MGKSLFLKHFQNNLSCYIENLLEEFNIAHLTVSTEDSALPGTFKGIMDLCIYDQNSPENIVAIEIEHKSNYDQAKRNIEKMKEWTHRSQSRSCSLLHIFNEESNITPCKINEIVFYARCNQQKNNGFFYDFIYYSVVDKRKTCETAEQLAFGLEFKTRLWILLKQVNLIS
jgi:hypothetical protein